MEVVDPKALKTSLKPENEKGDDVDLYREMKSLEQQLEFVELQEEYLKDEMRHLQRELLRAKEEIRRIQSVPLVIGQFNEMIDANYGIVSSTAGSNYYVRILSTLDRELLKPNTSIALHRHSHSVVDVLPPESDSTVKLMEEKPNVSYKDIGGMDVQKQEVHTSDILVGYIGISEVWTFRSRKSGRPLSCRSSSTISTSRSVSIRLEVCCCTDHPVPARP